jgi:hypothetical protein
MLVPITFLVLALVIAVAIGLYKAKRRVIDHDEPPDIRPDDPRPPNGPRGPLIARDISDPGGTRPSA